MNFFAPMSHYPSGELVGLGATRRPCTNRGTRPKSYDTAASRPEASPGRLRGGLPSMF